MNRRLTVQAEWRPFQPFPQKLPVGTPKRGHERVGRVRVSLERVCWGGSCGPGVLRRRRLGFAAVEVAPSPKVQLNVKAVPSGSEQPALEKLTASGASPEIGVPLATATGGRLVPTTAAAIVKTLEVAVFVPSETDN